MMMMRWLAVLLCGLGLCGTPALAASANTNTHTNTHTASEGLCLNQCVDNTLVNTDYVPYLLTLKHHIAQQWTMPETLEKTGSYKSVAVIEVLPSGQLGTVDFEVDSGNKTFNQAALDAIEHTAPFKPWTHISDRLHSVRVAFTYDFKPQHPKRYNPFSNRRHWWSL